MAKALAALVGIGSFLVGAGLQVSGVTNFWVGICLMVLGGACVLTALAGPLAGRSLSTAIVQAGIRHLELPPAPPAAPDLGALREAIQRMSGELRRNARLLREAAASRRYWLPSRQTLVASEWSACYTTLARYQGFEKTFESTRAAYDECDRINHVILDRIHATRSGDSWRDVRDSDRITDALQAITTATEALDASLAVIGPPA